MCVWVCVRVCVLKRDLFLDFNLKFYVVVFIDPFYSILFIHRYVKLACFYARKKLIERGYYEKNEEERVTAQSTEYSATKEKKKNRCCGSYFISFVFVFDMLVLFRVIFFIYF
jgi:hypothetical protein